MYNVTIIIDCKYILGYIAEHGLYHNYTIIDNHNGFWIITEVVNDELWFNVFYNPDYIYVGIEYSFSSNNLKECLDYCGILYYDGIEYR